MQKLEVVLNSAATEQDEEALVTALEMLYRSLAQQPLPRECLQVVRQQTAASSSAASENYGFYAGDPVNHVHESF